jgi:hypothetical protein
MLFMLIYSAFNVKKIIFVCTIKHQKRICRMCVQYIHALNGTQTSGLRSRGGQRSAIRSLRWRLSLRILVRCRSIDCIPINHIECMELYS